MSVAHKMGMLPGGKTITREIEMASSDGYRGFLRGLFDLDGTVISDHKKGISIRFSQRDPGILYAVQRMLLRLGVASKVYKKYNTKAQHELVISKDNVLIC